jgi:hypothetical protein
MLADTGDFKVPRAMHNRTLFWNQLRSIEDRQNALTAEQVYYGHWTPEKHDDLCFAAFNANIVTHLLVGRELAPRVRQPKATEDVGMYKVVEPAGYTPLTHSPVPALPEISSRPGSIY